VKPRKMDERLKRLAESMEDLPIKGTARIAWSCLTEREKLLYDKTDLIAQKPFYRSQLSDSELLARADEIFEDSHLLAKWHELYLRRIVDVFVTMFPGLTAFDLDDDVAEWYFMLHFYNFIKDWVDVVGNLRRWKKEDVEEWRKDMDKTGMWGKAFRLPRWWNEEDKLKAATTHEGKLKKKVKKRKMRRGHGKQRQ